MRNFLKNLKIVIFFDFFAEDVLKSLLRGPKTIRKKYLVVFEKFANLCSKSRKKKPTLDFGEFFEKKNIPIFFSNSPVFKNVVSRPEMVGRYNS